MALHGEIRVNATPIGYWSATRIVTADPNVYRCTIACEREGEEPLTDTFDLSHRYEDGALALAAKVVLAHAGGVLILPPREPVENWTPEEIDQFDPWEVIDRA